ncbi:uncharacterized protein LOC133860275 [Alnus glutinosa]|uniref:uncharacterized protein LOC133860275 n=1 Tax=Alnus glutinosa TaxID=3517 RepID=UPI002D7837CF|nr:uncharacterized protein LOC133860275 [Alnus glutinosa]
MNEKLVANFPMEEISDALNQMPPMKAPRPDGFLTCFYKHNWATIHQESAFISGRLIADNILVAYETLHSMQTRMWGKIGFIGVKLNMSKAYDRVEWAFLKVAMVRMGFHVKSISLVMACVRFVTYSVIVNRNPVGLIRPTRGIRQGDPISPYLFLLCAENLSALLSHAEQKRVENRN